MGGEEDTGSEGAGVLAVDREEGEDRPGVWLLSRSRNVQKHHVKHYTLVMHRICMVVYLWPLHAR